MEAEQRHWLNNIEQTYGRDVRKKVGKLIMLGYTPEQALEKGIRGVVK